MTNPKHKRVLEKVPEVIIALARERDALVQENEELRDKLAALEHWQRASELVEKMDRAGALDPDEPHRTKVARLLETGRDLSVLEEATQLNAGGGHVRSLRVVDEPASTGTTSRTPESRFQQALMGTNEY